MRNFISAIRLFVISSKINPPALNITWYRIWSELTAASLYREGMKIHMNRALQAGASKDEILEALLVSIMGGGIVSWTEGTTVMKGEGII